MDLQEILGSIDQLSLEEQLKIQQPRVLGLGQGTIWTSEDFDDELPDAFWGWDEDSPAS